MNAGRTITLALRGHGELRAGRWVGRVCAAASLWPLWYGLARASGVDWDALGFGLPLLGVGLALWWWCGYRLRNPVTGLVIDHAGQELRLVRGDVMITRCELGALAPWSYRSWQTTSTRDGVRHTTTWFAARNAAFGEQDLYVDTQKDACEAWVERVALAVRAPGDLQLDEVGARAIDRRLQAGGGRVGLALLTILCALWIAAAAPVLAASHTKLTQAVPGLAVLSAVLAVGWRVSGRRILGVVWAALTGLAFATKLWLVPISRSFLGEVSHVSPTSETGFYYLLPGLALMGVAGLMLALRPATPTPIAAPRTALPGATTRREVIQTKLPPPRVGE